MKLEFGPRRAEVVTITEGNYLNSSIPQAEIASLELLDMVYRGLCAVLYNYVPGSGHPGGSISSGRIVQSLLFHTMEYDLSDPDRLEADILSYAAGHKALGLYAILALRNEVARMTKPQLLPKNEMFQLRFEDLLGFRRNPEHPTPLFKRFKARGLDGHPSPATPFVKLCTGASGVGVASSVGLALGAADYYRTDPPIVNIIEGEGGLTPGRVSETLATAGTLGLKNVVMHIDWNQASIDSDKVCRSAAIPGDYVQWDPVELCYLNDWNVVIVPDGFNFQQIISAQEQALKFNNTQPTAIVYHTVKGWQYGIQGRASHGSGHKLCSDGFFNALGQLREYLKSPLPSCPCDNKRCHGTDSATIEACYWETLQQFSTVLKDNPTVVAPLGSAIESAKKRLDGRARKSHSKAPNLETIYDSSGTNALVTPREIQLTPGTSTTLREALGNVLSVLNKQSTGAFLGAAADLMGSTSLNLLGKDFGSGFWNFNSNIDSRLFAAGGICEDAMSGILSGLSSFGKHIGVGSSYGAFMAALGHIPARLHCIGNQSKRTLKENEPYKPFILVCAHAGLKTGEDGPTHADPQALQLLQDNFPDGLACTLTPWDPAEMWPLMVTALQKRPAFIAPFVTRPAETILDRTALRLAPATECQSGVYALRRASIDKPRDGTIILQESGVTYAFMQGVLPKLDAEGYNLNLFYVASAELFSQLNADEQEAIYSEELAREAIGITGFTLSTMYRWVRSNIGIEMTMHPFQKGHYLGSGSGQAVLTEAGLDADSQLKRIKRYISWYRKR